MSVFGLRRGICRRRRWWGSRIVGLRGRWGSAVVRARGTDSQEGEQDGNNLQKEEHVCEQLDKEINLTRPFIVPQTS